MSADSPDALRLGSTLRAGSSHLGGGDTDGIESASPPGREHRVGQR
ncbi:MAG: hypothetical protein R2710_26210 [Acidimicrobiales bacterium]